MYLLAFVDPLICILLPWCKEKSFGATTSLWRLRKLVNESSSIILLDYKYSRPYSRMLDAQSLVAVRMALRVFPGLRRLLDWERFWSPETNSVELRLFGTSRIEFDRNGEAFWLIRFLWRRHFTSWDFRPTSPVEDANDSPLGLSPPLSRAHLRVLGRFCSDAVERLDMDR